MQRVVSKPLLARERAAARVVAHAQRHAGARAAAVQVQRQRRLRSALRLRCASANFQYTFQLLEYSRYPFSNFIRLIECML